MKVSREQVAENRRRILEAAARLFRERGFEAVTVAEIMQAAGLTHGGFYGHFASKEELIAQAFADVLAVTPFGGEPGSVADYGAAYLTPAHRDGPGAGCLFATLGTESARASSAARHELTDALRRQIAQFSEWGEGGDAEKRRVAIVEWSAMVGAMLLARVADDAALSDEVLGETRAWLEQGGAGR